MSDAINPAPAAENTDFSSLVPVHFCRVDPTSRHVAMRLYAEASSDTSTEAGEHGFLMTPEQARQMIRDLSAAVLAIDVDMLRERGDAKDGDAHLREGAEPERQ